MRLKTPLVTLSSLGLLALAACGGSGSSGTPEANPSDFKGGDTGNNQQPDAKGPVTIDGAQKGGTVTVLTLTGLTTTIDPSEIYYTDTSSIMSGLVTRSLTQYMYDPSSGQMILVPDLATDLGQHNDTYTKWTFTIRPGVKWENGHAGHGQGGRLGHDPVHGRRDLPDRCLPVLLERLLQGRRRATRARTRPPARSTRASRSTATRSPSTWPSRSRTCPTGAASRPTARSRWARPRDPKTYKNHPLSTGPYMIKDVQPRPRSSCWSRTPTGTRRPTRLAPSTPTATTSRPSSSRRRSTRSCWPTPGPGQTTLTYDNLLAPDYQKMKHERPTGSCSAARPCTYYWAPDNRKITDMKVREALA